MNPILLSDGGLAIYKSKQGYTDGDNHFFNSIDEALDHYLSCLNTGELTVVDELGLLND